MNYVDKLCDMLGVTQGEWFKLKEPGAKDNESYTYNHEIYKIEDDDETFILKCKSTDEVIWKERGWNTELIDKILKGKLEIIKYKYIPKNRDLYWFYSIENDTTYQDKWTGRDCDYLRLLAGNCFSSENEARKTGKKIMINICEDHKEKIKQGL